MVFTEHTLTIAGSLLRYRERGVGQPLLFLHGAGGADSGLPFLTLLAERFRVLLPDHPGFGQSPDPVWLDNIHDAAYAYLDFLAALELRDVHLVGTSLGGLIELEIAVRDSHRLASLRLDDGDRRTGNLRRRYSNRRSVQLESGATAVPPGRRSRARRAHSGAAADRRAAGDGDPQSPHDCEARRGTALRRSQPAQVAASNPASDASDPLWPPATG